MRLIEGSWILYVPYLHFNIPYHCLYAYSSSSTILIAYSVPINSQFPVNLSETLEKNLEEVDIVPHIVATRCLPNGVHGQLGETNVNRADVCREVWTNG